MKKVLLFIVFAFLISCQQNGPHPVRQNSSSNSKWTQLNKKRRAKQNKKLRENLMCRIINLSGVSDNG